MTIDRELSAVALHQQMIELLAVSDVRKSELVDVVDTIILREMTKNLAYLQMKIDTGNMNNFILAVSAVVDAAAFASADKKR